MYRSAAQHRSCQFFLGELRVQCVSNLLAFPLVYVLNSFEFYPSIRFEFVELCVREVVKDIRADGAVDVRSNSALDEIPIIFHARIPCLLAHTLRTGATAKTCRLSIFGQSLRPSAEPREEKDSSQSVEARGTTADPTGYSLVDLLGVPDVDQLQA
jgi:hypothetical protein